MSAFQNARNTNIDRSTVNVVQGDQTNNFQVTQRMYHPFQVQSFMPRITTDPLVKQILLLSKH
jgi:hypothetical protein